MDRQTSSCCGISTSHSLACPAFLRTQRHAETDLLLLRPLRGARRAEGLRLLLLRSSTAMLSLLPAPSRPGLWLRHCPDLPSRSLPGLGAGLEPCTDWELGTPCLVLAGWGASWPPPLLLT